ncbi:MAG: tagH 2 [Rariglobus sp.]|jgi:lipopolysaccharide transport system ATP-binding protein|nr:tagH 2 [Rariglobus sp.]
MSDDVVIRAENISKRYRISHLAGQGTLRDTMHHMARLAWRRLRWNSKLNREDFWALRDVNFEIKRGEVVGIIGRNGAGKSTLLKILSRITEPTTGRITLKGRVASLLEVGTGFHPELTGRDNIFLNGAILGMSRVEIRKKFDEIVAFAEVERFLDTPVKRYSSGMYVRLAFAVAAHLEPEILIVDEVLAVGDAQFQKKCLGKIQSVAQNDGRTVLFVSHQMNAVQRLCTRAIVMQNGMIAADGPAHLIINGYLKQSAPTTASRDLTGNDVGRRGTGVARFTHIELRNHEGRSSPEILRGEPVRISISVHATKRIPNATFGFSFVTADGVEVMGSTATDEGISHELSAGVHQFSCLVEPMILNPGRYYIRAAIFSSSEVFDHIDEMIGVDVLSAASDQAHAPGNHWVGHVYLSYNWKHEHHSP